MNKMTIFTLVLLLNSSLLFSQVAVNSNSNPPDGSAMLDVNSTAKGMLVPRMTMAQRNLIASPATGLVVFQTDKVP